MSDTAYADHDDFPDVFTATELAWLHNLLADWHTHNHDDDCPPHGIRRPI